MYIEEPPVVFYILYGYKNDEYDKPTQIKDLGCYYSVEDCQRKIAEIKDDYAGFYYQYDNSNIVDEVVVNPFISADTDMSIVGNHKTKKMVNVKYYNSSYTYNKPVILCIVGESGSGKTTLSLHLQDMYNIPAICSYTTRPPRMSETNGVEHFFMQSFNEDPNNVLAYTMYGGYHYWTTTDQVEKHNIVSYVIDQQGLDELRNKWKERYHIISILVKRNNRDEIDEDRKARDKYNPIGNDFDIIIDNYYDNLNEFFEHSADKIKYFVEHMATNK